MSVQAGIYCRDRKDASKRDIGWLLSGLEDRGPDYGDIHVSKFVGMGFRGLLIAPEDRANQPLVENNNRFAITFDGRLDNRNEVARRVGLPETGECDAALVLLAYEHFGGACFHWLIGEFALVLWDDIHESLFLVRSLCGTRALYYTISNRQIVWSSELDDIVLKTDTPPVVNDAYAIGYSYYQPDIDESPFLNISVIPPGTYVEIRGAGELRPPVCTWSPETIVTLKLRSDEEYEEAWRLEMERVITARLRSNYPIFCELSGGFDSSTVALMSDRILRGRGRDPSMLTTVSYTYETSQSCDESYFIGLVERARGRFGLRIPEISQRATLGLDEVVFTGVPNVNHCTPGRYQTLRELMNSKGARVLLTGMGGDHLFWPDHTESPELADMLAAGRLWSLLSESRRWSQVSGSPLWQVLLTAAISPVIASYGIISSRPSNDNPPPWITRQARQWLADTHRGYGVRIDPCTRPHSRRVRATLIRSLRATLSAGYFNEYHAIHFSHPYAHQDLINFVLALPMNQLVRPGEERSIMRRATRGLLPEKLRKRKSKGTIDELFSRAVAREQHTVGDPASLEVCRRRYANPGPLSLALREAALGRVDQVYGLIRLLSCERWLRSLQTIQSRRSAVGSTRTECFGLPVPMMSFSK